MALDIIRGRRIMWLAEEMMKGTGKVGLCGMCKGQGFDPDDISDDCPQCRGTGAVVWEYWPDDKIPEFLAVIYPAKGDPKDSKEGTLTAVAAYIAQLNPADVSSINIGKVIAKG